MSAPNGASVVLLTGWDALRQRVERLRDVVMAEDKDNPFGGGYPEERGDVAALCDVVLALIDERSESAALRVPAAEEPTP